MATVKNTAKKSFENPYRLLGNYGAIVATLQEMGNTKWHTYSVFATNLKKNWEGWKKFAAKSARNLNGKDADERLMQNVEVIQRKDYGSPLHVQGAAIELKTEGDTLRIMLNLKAPVLKPAAVAKKSEKPTKVAKKPTAKKVDARPPILEGREALAMLKKKK